MPGVFVMQVAAEQGEKAFGPIVEGSMQGRASYMIWRSTSKPDECVVYIFTPAVEGPPDPEDAVSSGYAWYAPSIRGPASLGPHG